MGLSSALLLSAGDASAAVTLFPVHTVLPATTTIKAAVSGSKAFFQIRGNQPVVVLGEVVFDTEGAEAVEITVQVDTAASVSVQVKGAADKVLASLTIPSV